MVPQGLLTEHYQCYKSLIRILQICSFAPRRAAQSSEELKTSIIDHHSRFVRLYPDFVKPKFHQLLHTPENVDYLGLLLSCFVTERKHRTVKRAACWTFRNFEDTLIVDVVHRDIENLRGGNVFSREALTDPIDYQGLQTATAASLPGGSVRKGDLIACRGHRVIELERLWSGHGEIFVQGRSLLIANPAASSKLWRRTSEIVFLPSDMVIMPLCSASQGGEVRLILPPDGLGFEHR